MQWLLCMYRSLQCNSRLQLCITKFFRIVIWHFRRSSVETAHKEYLESVKIDKIQFCRMCWTYKPVCLRFLRSYLETRSTTTIDFLPRCRMQTRSSDENSVCLSVRLSVCQTRRLWQNERKICSYKRSFSLVFWEEEWLVGATSST